MHDDWAISDNLIATLTIVFFQNIGNDVNFFFQPKN